MSNLQIQEITFEGKIDYNSIKKLLSERHLGMAAYYINLSTFTAIDREDLIWKMQKIVAELKVNLIFPYPCYLIMGKGNYFNHCTFPQLETIGQLPSFFTHRRSARRKELGLNAKISTICEKLSGMPLDDNLKTLHQKLEGQDLLYLTCHQHAYLHAIELKRNKRKPHGRS